MIVPHFSPLVEISNLKFRIFPPKFNFPAKIQNSNFPAACIPLTSCPHLTLSCYMLGICIAEDKIHLVLDDKKIIDCKPSHMGIEHLQNRRGVLCYSLTSRIESNRGTEQSMCIIPASHFVIQLLVCPCIVLLAGFSLWQVTVALLTVPFRRLCKRHRVYLWVYLMQWWLNLLIYTGNCEIGWEWYWQHNYEKWDAKLTIWKLTFHCDCGKIRIECSRMYKFNRLRETNGKVDKSKVDIRQVTRNER